MQSFESRYYFLWIDKIDKNIVLIYYPPPPPIHKHITVILLTELIKGGICYSPDSFAPVWHYSCSFQEICSNPKFVVEKATRFDLDQGSIGQ